MIHELHLHAHDLLPFIDHYDDPHKGGTYTGRLTLEEQSRLMGISKSSLYYHPVEPSDEDLLLQRAADEIFTKRPFYGARKIAHELTRQTGIPVGRKRARSIMQILGIEAIYPKPNLSANSTPHLKYLYLLKGVVAQCPNHIWGTDITYIRMPHGFMYLVAYIDWHSRYVISWELSNTLSDDFVIAAGKRALSIATPRIANSDQGVQFTGEGYTSLWDLTKTQISMDGRGRALDNIFTERLWRSVKYEEVYLKEYDSVEDLRISITNYFIFYNTERPHQALGNKTPAEVYWNSNS